MPLLENPSGTEPAPSEHEGRRPVRQSYMHTSEMVEWLYQALNSPKGIILSTEEPAALLSALCEAKASSHSFFRLRLISLEERGQVWIIKD